MAMAYQHPQTYSLHEQQQWHEDYKATYSEYVQTGLDDDRRSSAATPANFSNQHSRRPSMLKTEEDYSPVEAMPSWHEKQHDPHFASRHYSYPTVYGHGHVPPFVSRDPNFAASYAQPHPQWTTSQSGTNTPTQTYGGSAYGPPVQYAQHHDFDFNQDPVSAVSMSPQSSQGGWASASSDGMDQRCMMQSPMHRPESPQPLPRSDGMVQRSDGIRKKNARFEIPSNRNLATIDEMIRQSTDDVEKKELKQQKRLLRNRQAALDSRQRKKSHTEKLEQEKKLTETHMSDLQTAVNQLSDQLHIEREQWTNQRQQYDIQIQQLLQERDEAIKQKTLETADARRQLNAMREYIREQQQKPSGYGPASDMNNIASDFDDFSLDNEWEHEFSLIENGELVTDENENTQRQAAPKPTPVKSEKAETEFSWNTFYMCLLFGALAVSAGGQLAKNGDDIKLPTVSDLHRADAQNVLNAVLSSNSRPSQELITAKSISATATSAADFSYTSARAHSEFDTLSSALTTPSKEQELQQIFAMTPADYNHITNPLAQFEDDADADLPDSPRPRPVGTRLERALAAFNANKSPTERDGFLSREHEQSAINVPDSVMDDFRAFVQETRRAQAPGN